MGSRSPASIFLHHTATFSLFGRRHHTAGCASAVASGTLWLVLSDGGWWSPSRGRRLHRSSCEFQLHAFVRHSAEPSTRTASQLWLRPRKDTVSPFLLATTLALAIKSYVYAEASITPSERNRGLMRSMPKPAFLNRRRRASLVGHWLHRRLCMDSVKIPCGKQD